MRATIAILLEMNPIYVALELGQILDDNTGNIKPILYLNTRRGLRCLRCGAKEVRRGLLATDIGDSGRYIRDPSFSSLFGLFSRSLIELQKMRLLKSDDDHDENRRRGERWRRKQNHSDCNLLTNMLSPMNILVLSEPL
jgi:hypothetical protein